MKIVVLKEDREGERRVAATPETVKKLVALGADCAVETGAATHIGIADSAYESAGATVATRDSILKGAGLVLSVRAPDPGTLDGVAQGATVIGFMAPYQAGELIAAYAGAGLRAMAVEFVPRITRAQSMDALSSQANLAGYKAAIAAADAYDRAIPMMMTAAGTVVAARAFIMGVGVAGLQAIASVRRMGAVVSATDVRSAVREQIESLGAKAIFVEQVEGISGEGTGGYASEMSDEYKKAQAELVSRHIAKQDIVITTALIPGRPAPRLISDAQIATMTPGSVIVDLAVEQGGNVEGAVAGETVERHGVKIIGSCLMSSCLSSTASMLYARNLYALIAAFWNGDEKTLVWPEDDEIVQGMTLTSGGEIVHPNLQQS